MNNVPTRKVVRDPRTGRMVEVRGYGALKGQLKLARSLDLTKPIYDQVSKAVRHSPKNP